MGVINETMTTNTGEDAGRERGPYSLLVKMDVPQTLKIELSHIWVESCPTTRTICQFF